MHDRMAPAMLRAGLVRRMSELRQDCHSGGAAATAGRDLLPEEEWRLTL